MHQAQLPDVGASRLPCPIVPERRQSREGAWRGRRGAAESGPQRTTAAFRQAAGQCTHKWRQFPEIRWLQRFLARVPHCKSHGQAGCTVSWLGALTRACLPVPAAKACPKHSRFHKEPHSFMGSSGTSLAGGCVLSCVASAEAAMAGKRAGSLHSTQPVFAGCWPRGRRCKAGPVTLESSCGLCSGGQSAVAPFSASLQPPSSSPETGTACVRHHSRSPCTQQGCTHDERQGEESGRLTHLTSSISPRAAALSSCAGLWPGCGSPRFEPVLAICQAWPSPSSRIWTQCALPSKHACV